MASAVHCPLSAVGRSPYKLIQSDFSAPVLLRCLVPPRSPSKLIQLFFLMCFPALHWRCQRCCACHSACRFAHWSDRVLLYCAPRASQSPMRPTAALRAGTCRCRCESASAFRCCWVSRAACIFFLALPRAHFLACYLPRSRLNSSRSCHVQCRCWWSSR
jgi:hypothetical protein